MVKTVTRGISEYDIVHCPPSHTYHPTTKKELLREHISYEQSRKKNYPTIGPFQNIEEFSNGTEEELKHLRMDMLRQQIDQDIKEGFPDWNLTDSWFSKINSSL
ncbi:predicted protein [Naegleria gruberi]|uniref:Predicted protein n=1 Tax=Naegleria gruberi TaxID=5762 RepID=D2VMX9_NAEGR|nr:uncharacterized protein NAEGRDRAFT_70298 [Naegleria gruberi]EFC41820.1 predicted protein [Naegleria gruberi]|eukprot:XP_002674564.1 predicted protein [Naegleria gruberi strain NEG-M]